MDNSQKNELSMFLAVLGVMESDEYKTAWTPLAGIADLVAQLEDRTNDIQQRSGVQGTSRTGIAQGKNRKQVAMINLTIAVAGDLHAHAVKAGDDTLAGQTDLETSDLVNMADHLVGPHCQEIAALATANAAALIPYGTTAADLTALSTAINDYMGVAAAPRLSTAKSTSVTADIASDVQAANALLKKQLDKAMAKFKTRAPRFTKRIRTRG